MTPRGLAVLATLALVATSASAPAAAFDTTFSSIPEGAYPKLEPPSTGDRLPPATLPPGFSFLGVDAARVRQSVDTARSEVTFDLDLPRRFFGPLGRSGVQTWIHPSRSLVCMRGLGARGALLEEVAVAPDGTATLDVHRTWIDPAACSFAFLGDERLALKPIGLLDGAPVAFAVRKDDQLTLFFPPTSGLAVSAENDRLSVTRGTGALDRVVVPVHRGMATSVEAQIQGFREWVRTASGEPRHGSTPSTTMVVGVDVTQTSSDKEPLVVVHVGSDR